MTSTVRQWVQDGAAPAWASEEMVCASIDRNGRQIFQAQVAPYIVGANHPRCRRAEAARPGIDHLAGTGKGDLPRPAPAGRHRSRFLYARSATRLRECTPSVPKPRRVCRSYRSDITAIVRVFRQRQCLVRIGSTFLNRIQRKYQVFRGSDWHGSRAGPTDHRSR